MWEPQRLRELGHRQPPDGRPSLLTLGGANTCAAGHARETCSGKRRLNARCTESPVRVLQPLPALGSGLRVTTRSAHLVFPGLWRMLLHRQHCPCLPAEILGTAWQQRAGEFEASPSLCSFDSTFWHVLHSLLMSILTHFPPQARAQPLCLPFLYLTLCVKLIKMLPIHKLGKERAGRLRLQGRETRPRMSGLIS